jgi:hypothetical protein
MKNIAIGDVFKTNDQRDYLVIIGHTQDELSILKANLKQCLPSGGEVVSLKNEIEFNNNYSENYDFSHNIDVSGWLEFKKKQIIKILKG